MKKFAILVAALSMLATVIPANAGSCVTTCSGSYNTRTCFTNCY